MIQTVLKQPRFTDLTVLSTVKEEIGLTGTLTDDVFINRRIRQASAAICQYVGRKVLARRLLHEGVPAYSKTILMVDQTPLLVISQLVLTQTPAQNISPIFIDPTSYVISNPDTGFIFAPLGWVTTEIVGFASRFSILLETMPDPANNGMYYVDYTAGYLMPQDDVIAGLGSGTGYSFSSVDGSLNKASGKFPLLIPGDVFTVTGATSAANNALFTVASATDSKIITVENGMVTEVAPTDNFSVSFRTLPDDLEVAAIETVKSWFFSRDRDSFVKTERVGGARSGAYQAEYNVQQALPPTAVALLSKYRRVGD